jgi:hypothetical protein
MTETAADPAASPAQPATEEQPPVEVHKPKPVHNWREFLKEYAIIVLGVFTALAGEQAVEWLHWQGEVKTARQAIHAEMAANEANLFVRRLSYEPCVVRQIREAEAILADLEAGRKPGSFTTFHTGASGPASDGEWQAQRAAQTLTHFPPEELAMMGSYYKWVSDFEGWTAREEDSWSELAVLRNPPAGLGPSDFMRLRASLAAIRRTASLVEANSGRALKMADALSIPRQPVDQNRLRLFCSMNEEDFVPSVRNADPSLR